MDKAGQLVRDSGHFSLRSHNPQLSLLPTAVIALNHKIGHVTLLTLPCTWLLFAPGIKSKLISVANEASS